MSAEFNFQELKVADRLPSPSGVALAILQLAEREDANTGELAELVKGDPALTSRLLRLANSPAMAVRRPIVAVGDSIVLLGMKVVKQFALSLSLASRYKDGHCHAFDYTGYWAYSLAFGVSSQAITGRDRTVAPEEAFTLGLLAEVGRLALATAWPGEYAEVLQTAKVDMASEDHGLLEQEYRRFVVNHRVLSQMLLADWGVPEVLREAMRLSYLEEIPEDDGRVARFARQLALARLFARHCVACEPARAQQCAAIEAQARRLGFCGEGAGCMEEMLREVEEQWREWGQMLGIATERKAAAPASPTSGPSGEPAATVQEALHILMVDDDPLVLTRLGKQLAALGHQVTPCRDGQSALKLALERPPDLLITDWHMKPLDGLRLTQVLRASAFGQRLYIIMLTATEDEDALVKAFEAGIDDYVVKPPSLKVLAARIRAGQRIVGLQRALHREREEIERYSAELALANRRLEQLANTDMLTGLPNRRYALHRLEQEWLTAQRFDRPLSVMIADLDNFKRINDGLGHEAGDEVLNHAAQVMNATLRGSDVICRMGGEEFIVIAPNTDGAAAMKLAERVRATIQGQQPRNLALESPLTVSIGVAATVGGRLTPKDLIKYADDALYQAKNASRNAVRVACT